MLVLQNVLLLLQSVGCSSRTSEILQGRANRSTGRSPSDSQAAACTWKLHRFRWGLFKPHLCCLHFRSVVAHGTRSYSNPVKGQLGFILDDVHNMKY